MGKRILVTIMACGTWVAGGATAGCSFVLDSKADQCEIDSDCNHLITGHPLCQQGVCVDAGLQPTGCVFTPPTKQSDFLNACSTSKYEPFDNCGRLGLGCNNASIALPTTVDPPSTPPGTLQMTVDPPTVSCSLGIPQDHVIYMYGAADFAPMLLAAQKSLSKLTPPYRAVFQNASSCNGVNAVFDPASFRLMKDPTLTSMNGGWAFYYDVNDPNNPVQVNCLINSTPGTPGTQGPPITPYVGVSDLYSQTCNPAFIPGSSAGSLAEYVGPVVQFGFSVPATSKQTSISQEAVHFIFGRGGKAPAGTMMMDAQPWTDPTTYAIRNSGAASTVLTALLADVPRTKFWGVDRLSTDNLRDTLLQAVAIDSSIGILSIDYNDKNRDNLRALYLQAKDQRVGYLPDSSAVAYDKANVRDGHYPLWGYVHFFTPLQGDGNPAPQASAVVLKFRVERIDQSLVDDIIAASLVPQCAMKVARTTEMGDFMTRSGFSCGCYFEAKTHGAGLANCKTCNSAADCTDSTHPACNYGYCETR